MRRATVRDLAKVRPGITTPLPPGMLSTRWQDLIEDPAVDVVVELMGGIDEPLALIRAALEAGKMVVTGNKALLAEHGQEVFALAAERKVPVFFEASTAGGIPIIKTIREALIANHIVSIHGIINGTSNYILTRMTDAGLTFGQALAEAQAEGYAEADPTLDINGWDAAHKAVILASLAYGFWVGTDRILVEGIEALSATDISFADNLGYRIKLLAIIKANGHSGNGGDGNLAMVRGGGAGASDTHPQDARAGVGFGGFQRCRGAGRRGGRDTLLRTRRGPGPDEQRGDQRSGGSGHRAGRSPAVLWFHTARIVRNLPAVGGDRLALLPEAGGRRQTRRAGAGGGDSWALQHRNFVRGPARGARPGGRAQLVFMLDLASHEQMHGAMEEILRLPCVSPPAALLRVEGF